MENYKPQIYEILSKKLHLPKERFYCNIEDNKIYFYSDRLDKNRKPINLEDFIDNDNKKVIMFAISMYGIKNNLNES